MPTPEEKSRLVIDQKLVAAGWKVQDMGSLNFGAGLGVAVRQSILKRAFEGKLVEQRSGEGLAASVLLEKIC